VKGSASLDAIFEHTPLEALRGLNDGLDTQADEIDYKPGAVERSSWQVLGEMLETRGSDMYLWHLGMHPDQFT
jgi:hypothetical protein